MYAPVMTNAVMSFTTNSSYELSNHAKGCIYYIIRTAGYKITLHEKEIAGIEDKWRRSFNGSQPLAGGHDG